MKCRAVRNRILDHIDCALPPKQAQAVAAHLSTCSSCRAELESFRRSEGVLGKLAAVEAPPEPAMALRWPVSTRPVRRTRSQWEAAAALAAASIVLFLWLYPRHPALVSKPHRSQMEIAKRGADRKATVPAVSTPRGKVSLVRDDGSPPRPRRQHVRDRQDLRPRPALRQPPREPVTATEPPQSVGVESTGTGLVLVLGQPQEVRPWSQYDVEVVRPDGSRSVQQQEVDRAASGQPKAIVIVCREIAPNAPARDYGGVR